MTNLEAKQQAKASKGAAVAAPATFDTKSEQIFGMMATYLKQGLGKPLIPKVDSVFCFEITMKKGQKPFAIFEIDLKNGEGKTQRGAPAKADATFTMTDADFEAVCLGKLNPQIAFM